ncbi:Por secretion system C-terminal sorting domain-containing protein [Flaviramulus basaltis]|uniref:Por secretion system C-terminal sorting domain-containing protein n=1 Tax=Flaviramulus basaltis TaxID=369401 RepID=A0A1K2IPZ0_9FLAO|nr:T9SS type A sorting domain-containing protein [Flaviramulus basaltis]SFZ94374.1 Por secretion system C-terminal sorting domain-containing protein [Flaviramulus basaltis]
MLNKFTFLLLLLTANFIFSQDLYVSDNSYLYARDVVVFVNDDIRLETPTSNLFFRGDAQLIQNTDTKNSDAGELSIYQNQTTNVYEYNYWCSPVGVSIDGTVQDNVVFDGTNIHDPDDDTDVTNVLSIAYSFTTAYNGTATELSNYWIYTLIDGEGYYSWNQVFDTGLIDTGYGFTLKGSTNPNNVLDFRGRPNNGTITVSCAFDGTDNQPTSGTLDTAETLTGNPYPSALDLKLFIIGNTSIADGGTAAATILSGEIFFWEQKVKNSHYLADYEGGYGVYTPGELVNLADNGTYATAAFEDYNQDGSTNSTTTLNTTDYSTNNARRFAAVGQGFVIQSNNVTNGGLVTFNNSMRLYLPEDSNAIGNGSIFAKNGNSKNNEDTENEIVVMSHNGLDYKSIIENPTIVPEIRLHTYINNTFYKENVIAFRETTPDNNTYNRFYDGGNINELSSDAYLISSNKELVIKSINYDESTRIPFGLKASKDNTLFNIKIHKLKDIPESVSVYVFDNENNTYTDVKNGTLEVTLNSGIHNNRFEITFAKNSLDIVDNTFTDFEILQNNSISQLKLINPTGLSIKSINVFDVSGKKVLVDKINSTKSEYSYSTKSFSNGVYIVKITSSNNQIFNKKVVVSNKNN